MGYSQKEATVEGDASSRPGERAKAARSSRWAGRLDGARTAEETGSLDCRQKAKVDKSGSRCHQ